MDTGLRAGPSRLQGGPADVGQGGGTDTPRGPELHHPLRPVGGDDERPGPEGGVHGVDGDERPPGGLHHRRGELQAEAGRRQRDLPRAAEGLRLEGDQAQRRGVPQGGHSPV